MSENREVDTNALISIMGSALVIVSYFVVWSPGWKTGTTGFQLLGDVPKGIASIGGVGELLMLLYIISPILCHGANLLITFTSEDKKPSFRLILLPIIIWVGLALYFLFVTFASYQRFREETNGNTEALFKSWGLVLKMLFLQPGTIMAMIGMAVSLIFSRMSSSAGESQHSKHKVFITPPRGPAGATFKASGMDFTPGSSVTLCFKNMVTGEMHRDATVADSNGNFSYLYTVEESTPKGSWQFWAAVNITGKISNTVTYDVL